MANIWEEFDKSIDTEGLAKDVEEAAENGGRREVPHDTYEVAINKLELTKSKKGDPMVTCWMKIVEGEYKGSLIFMNQVVTQGFQIHIANEFMRALVQEMETPVEVQFKTYSQYANMIMDIMEAIDQIANDIAVLFNTKYLGVVPNDAAGRTSLWSDIVQHHEQLEEIRAIEDFADSDVVVEQGNTKKSVVVTDAVTVVNAMSKLYMTVTVA